MTNRKKMSDTELVEYYIYESSCGYGKEAIEVIAKTTGRTEDEVIELLHANGVARKFKTGKEKKMAKKTTDAQKEEITRRYRNGESAVDIARDLGVSDQTVYNTVNKAKKEQPEPIPAVQTVEENVSAEPTCCTSSVDIIAEIPENVKIEVPETAAIPEDWEIEPDTNPEEIQERCTVFSDEFRAEARKLAERYGGSLRKLEVDYDEAVSRMSFKCGPYELVVAVR